MITPKSWVIYPPAHSDSVERRFPQGFGKTVEENTKQVIYGKE